MTKRNDSFQAVLWHGAEYGVVQIQAVTMAFSWSSLVRVTTLEGALYIYTRLTASNTSCNYWFQISSPLWSNETGKKCCSWSDVSSVSLQEQEADSVNYAALQLSKKKTRKAGRHSEAVDPHVLYSAIRQQSSKVVVTCWHNIMYN